MLETKCLLCKSEWGNYFQEILGRNEKFCCRVCAIQVQNLIIAINSQYAESVVEIKKIMNHRSGRICQMKFDNGMGREFSFDFTPSGEVRFLEPVS